jgi:hypothetical protein
MKTKALSKILHEGDSVTHEIRPNGSQRAHLLARIAHDGAQTLPNNHIKPLTIVWSFTLVTVVCLLLLTLRPHSQPTEKTALSTSAHQFTRKSPNVLIAQTNASLSVPIQHLGKTTYDTRRIQHTKHNSKKFRRRKEEITQSKKAIRPEPTLPEQIIIEMDSTESDLGDTSPPKIPLQHDNEDMRIALAGDKDQICTIITYLPLSNNSEKNLNIHQ